MNKFSQHNLMEKLFTVYEQKIYRIAYSILHNTQQAEDVTQEVFLTIFAEIDKFKQPTSEQAAKRIYYIAKNKAIDVYRRNKRELEMIEKVRIEHPKDKNNVEDNLLQIVSREAFRELLDTLPDKYKDVLMYRAFYELSSIETAAILNITEPTVRKRYERAKAMAVKYLGGEINEFREKIC